MSRIHEILAVRVPYEELDDGVLPVEKVRGEVVEEQVAIVDARRPLMKIGDLAGVRRDGRIRGAGIENVHEALVLERGGGWVLVPVAPVIDGIGRRVDLRRHMEQRADRPVAATVGPPRAGCS